MDTHILSMRKMNGHTVKIAPALLVLAIALLQPAPEAFADVSVQDKEVLAAVDKVAPTVEEIAKKLWELSEVSLLEIKSSAYLKNLLKKNGFTITSDKAAGVPTSFVAEYGKGEPELGILLEYDALPGLGNEPVAKEEPRKDGVTSGHGCGHNLIGAGAMGAALAIKQLMEDKRIPGTLRVYGAAAEESEGAKVFMARAGLFMDGHCQQRNQYWVQGSRYRVEGPGAHRHRSSHGCGVA
jgi:aminobenzoyl-glutamate utilization protein B